VKKTISWILLISWAFIIFFLSNQSGELSSNESQEIINYVINSNEDILNMIHNPLREFMHFFEYFIFGILLYNVFLNYNVKEKIIASILISFIYILTDEIHQTFIPGRTFELLDIGLDLAGSIVGIYIFKVYKQKKV